MAICNVLLKGSGGVHKFEHDIGPFKSTTDAAGWLREEGYTPYRGGWLKKGKALVVIYGYDATGKVEYRTAPVKRIFARVIAVFNPKFTSHKSFRE